MSNQLKWQQRRDALAKDLATKFTNGQHSYVVTTLHEMTAEHAAVITAKVACLLPNAEDFAVALSVRTQHDIPDGLIDDEQDESDDDDGAHTRDDDGYLEIKVR